MQSLFKVGDKAVYPAHGVIEIIGIETRSIGDREEIFYVLMVPDTNKKIMVPLKKIKDVGLRQIVEKRKVNEIYKILKFRDVKFNEKNWNRRYRKYIEKIKTGSLKDVAEVMRDLYLLRAMKILSFGEKKMLDTAKHLFTKEISIVKQMNEKEVEKEIEKIFPPPKEIEPPKY